MRLLMVLIILAGCGADDPPQGSAAGVGTISTGVEPL